MPRQNNLLNSMRYASLLGYVKRLGDPNYQKFASTLYPEDTFHARRQHELSRIASLEHKLISNYGRSNTPL